MALICPTRRSDTDPVPLGRLYPKRPLRANPWPYRAIRECQSVLSSDLTICVTILNISEPL